MSEGREGEVGLAYENEYSDAMVVVCQKGEMRQGYCRGRFDCKAERLALPHSTGRRANDLEGGSDLGSTNQVLVNGGETLSAELKNGDKIELGEHEFQFVLEGRKRDPKTYRLEED